MQESRHKLEQEQGLEQGQYQGRGRAGARWGGWRPLELKFVAMAANALRLRPLGHLHFFEEVCL
jgi:hypothetical protein